MPHKRAKRSVRDADKAKKGYNLAPSARDDDMPRGAMRILNSAKVQADFRARGGRTSEDTGERRPKEKGKGKEDGKGKDGKDGKEEKGKDGKGKGKGNGKDKESGDGPKAKKAKTDLPKIGEHETLGAYNRRIEGLLRGGVNAAIKAAEQARGQELHAAKEAKAERIAKAQGKKRKESESESEDEAVVPDRPERTFAELPQRKRLNDVVQAPPQLPRLRQAKDKDGVGSAWGATGRTPLSAAQQRILDTERERVVALYREMKAKKEADKEKGKGKPAKAK